MMSFYLSQSEHGGGFLRMSVHGMLSFHFSQGENGIVLTYVCTWLSPCHVFVSQGEERVVLTHARTPGFACGMSSYLLQSEQFFISFAR